MPPPDEEEARAARLEIAALQLMLKARPPDQAEALRAEATARIRELAAQLGVEIPVGAVEDGVP